MKGKFFDIYPSDIEFVSGSEAEGEEQEKGGIQQPHCD